MGVRSYTDKELLDKAIGLASFNGVPNGYWILGVRSQEDMPNKFDDKFYLFKGMRFITVVSGTTNPGTVGLLKPMREEGTALVKEDMWHYDVWEQGLHKGKMRCLKQIGPMYYTRDNDKDDKSEESGVLYRAIIGINFHGVDYKKFSKKVTTDINGWSYGCQVVNNMPKYYKILDTIGEQKTVSFCLLKEF